ncbi:D-glycero-beta-D-manno-heptose 1,7-bisphosphate 7-phosphatase [uncultured Lamprocystis sp.]|jgi:D-glycero-D-manno-heptose 1,7-bisphosphate phosphatase|uniref:D-glycero-beta-D-manno-heptose 1,7-bisphosphate 7-phosphatase n=1 Tax=uncultured Lamprocystis sp. TaxID=543132 RepID=UPI0025F201F7|nr:D-glycero-beta-D-manno-heptose 1,7-bisphosphate 7-phosphatase [uncultured Lamprocystis sp.]
MAVERFVAIDRDGVINEDSDEYIKSESEWNPIAGSIDGIARLTQAGFRIAIVTNQSGLARGLFDLSALNGIHKKLQDCLSRQGGRVEMIFFCPHGPTDHCNCRKPKPGLLLAIEDRFNLDLTGLPFIGDSFSDIEAARNVGMEPILVRTGKGEQTLLDHSRRLSGIRVFTNLNEATHDLLNRWRNA